MTPDPISVRIPYSIICGDLQIEVAVYGTIEMCRNLAPDYPSPSVSFEVDRVLMKLDDKSWVPMDEEALSEWGTSTEDLNEDEGLFVEALDCAEALY